MPSHTCFYWKPVSISLHGTGPPFHTWDCNSAANLTQIKSQSKKKSSYSYSSELSKNLFLFSPGAGLHGGVLFQLATDRWWMDMRIRADYVPKIEDKYELDEYTQGNIGFNKMLNIGGNIGILYKF